MGNCTCCTSVSCMSEEGQSQKVTASRATTAPMSISVWHCQTSSPSTLGLQATSMLSVWGKVDGRRVYGSWAWACSDPKQSFLVDHFIYSGLLVTRACHNVLVVCRDVAAQDRWGFLGLEYAGAIRSPPSIQQIVLPSAYEPFTTVGELKGEDTALVQVELILVRLWVVEHLHVAALHTHSKPLSSRTVAQGEDLETG